MPIRAWIDHENAEQAVARFHGHLRSFRNQVTYRRKFILAELDTAKP